MIENYIPKEWVKVNADDYQKIGIVNNSEISCVGAYTAGTAPDISLVSFYDYSKQTVEFLEELERHYSKIDNLNRIIDGDPNDADYENTAVLTPLFHGNINKDKGLFYLAICKVAMEKGYSYAVKLFHKGSQGLFGFDVTLNSLDEKNVVNSAIEKECIKKAVHILIHVAAGK